MKITIYTAKGGVGKTPIAVNMALDYGYALATNELFNMLDQTLDPDQLLTVGPEQAFPDFGPEVDVVFDLAGMIGHTAAPSITSAIRQSDVVLVPVTEEIKALNGAAHTIVQLRPLTDRIVVVATKLEKRRNEKIDDWKQSRAFGRIQNYLEARTGQGLPMLPLKRSTAYDAIFEQDRSMGDVMRADRLRAHSYREVHAQFEALMRFLESNYAPGASGPTPLGVSRTLFQPSPELTDA